MKLRLVMNVVVSERAAILERFKRKYEELRVCRGALVGHVLGLETFNSVCRRNLEASFLASHVHNHYSHAPRTCLCLIWDGWSMLLYFHCICFAVGGHVKTRSQSNFFEHQKKKKRIVFFLRSTKAPYGVRVSG